MSNKIQKFSKDNLDPVLDDVMNELRKVGEKYGLHFDRKTCRYGAAEFRMTVTAEVLDKLDGCLTDEESNYDWNARVQNLPERGFQYYNQGITMTVVGWNKRARKYPIILKGSDGKSYKSSVMNLKGRV